MKSELIENIIDMRENVLRTTGPASEELFILLGPEEYAEIGKFFDSYWYTRDDDGSRIEHLCGMRVLRADWHVAGRAVLRRSAVRELAIEAGFYPLDAVENAWYLTMEDRLRKAQESREAMRSQVQMLTNELNLWRRTELAVAVRDMRDWQRTYFRTRSPEALQRSKQAEKEVDALIQKIDNPNKPTQGELL